jgi:hypothetical protein
MPRLGVASSCIHAHHEFAAPFGLHWFALRHKLTWMLGMLLTCALCCAVLCCALCCAVLCCALCCAVQLGDPVCG